MKLFAASRVIQYFLVPRQISTGSQGDRAQIHNE